MALLLVAESAPPVAGALRRFLESAGHEVVVAGEPREALARLRALAPAALLASCSGGFDGEALCREVRGEAPDIPVLLLYPPEEEQPEARAAAAGAEGCLVGPLKRATVVTCVGLVLKLAAAREREAQARTEAEEKRWRGEAASPELAFLKRLLLMEVKRSRRYRYPIAFLLVEADRFAERVAPLPAAQRTAVQTELLRRLSEGLREIDLAVPFAEGRFIVFLPHTPHEGAVVVAERMRQRLKAVESLPELTASLGVAVFEPAAKRGQAQVSFGSLLKEAGEALRRAQAAGGDRVELAERAPRERISIG